MSDIRPQLKKEMKRGRVTAERFWEIIRELGFHPHERIPGQKADILIAYSDLEHDRIKDYPWGYYQVVWAIVTRASKGFVDGFSWCEFEAMHDMDKNLTPEQKHQSRINRAVGEAKGWIKLNLEVGRYG